MLRNFQICDQALNHTGKDYKGYRLFQMDMGAKKRRYSVHDRSTKREGNILTDVQLTRSRRYCGLESNLM
jgi:hypothetical protein